MKLYLRDFSKSTKNFKSCKFCRPYLRGRCVAGATPSQGLGALAEYERSLIIARSSEGRERAKQRVVVFGRKPKLSVARKPSMGDTERHRQDVWCVYQSSEQ